MKDIKDILNDSSILDKDVALYEFDRDKEKNNGYQSLDKIEKIILDIELFVMEINNGGFDQFFFNSIGDRYQEILNSLEEIKANKTKDLLQQACKNFTDGAPPKDRFKRQDELSNVDKELLDNLDKRFYKYEDNIGELLVDFVKSAINSE
jgi:predicted lactoylglutathione lyase